MGLAAAGQTAATRATATAPITRIGQKNQVGADACGVTSCIAPQSSTGWINYGRAWAHRNTSTEVLPKSNATAVTDRDPAPEARGRIAKQRAQMGISTARIHNSP